MNILMLTPQMPYPPYQGATLRNLGLLRGLAKTDGCKVWLMTFQTPGQPAPEETPLVELCERVIAVPAPPPRPVSQRLRDLFLTPAPDMKLRLLSSAFADALRDLLDQRAFDYVQIEGIEMAAFLPLLVRSRLVYDAHNAEYKLQRSAFLTDLRDPRRWPGALYSFVQWQRLIAFEREVCESADHVLAVSQMDALALRELDQDVPIIVVPNGIDTESYAQPPAEAIDLGPNALVFTGKMDYRPNVDAVLWFADAILPLVPDAHLVIVGQKPHPRLARLRENPRVTVTGWVPEILPYLHAATIYVAPLRMGGGTRFKVLEAMAAGKPVVTTTFGAQGLEGGEDVARIADSAAAFAEEIKRLLADPAARDALGERGRVFVRENYDWDRIIPSLVNVYGCSRRKIDDVRILP